MRKHRRLFLLHLSPWLNSGRYRYAHSVRSPLSRFCIHVFKTIVSLELGTLCQDNRLDICYTDYKYGTGGGPINGIYPKNICCCSPVGKAWGSGDDGGKARCEPCPRPGSTTFLDLCPKVRSRPETHSHFSYILNY